MWSSFPATVVYGPCIDAETDVWTEEFVNDTGWHNDTTYLKLTLVDIPYATLVSWPICSVVQTTTISPAPAVVQWSPYDNTITFTKPG